MKLSVATSLALLLAPSLFAGVFSFPDENPVVSLTIPASWKPSEDEQGVEATSPDGEVYIDVETTTTKTVEQSIDEAISYLKDKGVKVDASTVKQQELKLNGMDVYDISWDGTDEDGACKISLSVVGATKSKGLLMIYWASPEGEKSNQKTLSQIASSIKPVSP